MSYLSRLKRELWWIVIFVVAIWCVFVIDQVLPLETFGLKPRSMFGLIGIASMTFLHGSLSHIISNTFPLFTLLLLLVSSRANSLAVVVMTVCIGGALLWIFGNPRTIHIGASLLVFGLAGFLLVSGFFFERKISTTIISIFVLLSYGGALISGIAPWQKGVSWDGHLYGFIAGSIVAFVMSRQGRRF